MIIVTPLRRAVYVCSSMEPYHTYYVTHNCPDRERYVDEILQNATSLESSGILSLCQLIVSSSPSERQQSRLSPFIR